jgi:hypothetical protein
MFLHYGISGRGITEQHSPSSLAKNLIIKPIIGRQVKIDTCFVLNPKEINAKGDNYE